MTISYNWLSTYLPVIVLDGTPVITPDKLAGILTSIGLEVESMEKIESIRGGLEGLVTGRVISCEKHPDADKLSVAKVDLGNSEVQIVCGANNIREGLQVIVAPVGSEIYPTTGGIVSIKKAKIRGIESQGMICSEDEIGLGTVHDGIMILPSETKPGTLVKELFNSSTDYVYEIGLTPNRIDAMSHIGVARDVCAYLSHHYKLKFNVAYPDLSAFQSKEDAGTIEVVIENAKACRRYSGITISGITVTDSPDWLIEKLQSIGLKSINNIVDATNFILHETGQPLHAFDANAILGNKIIVRSAVEGEPFVTLDEKERKLKADDLVICNETSPMCLAGIYGGIHSGVTSSTKNIFLESAWFDPIVIRKSSLTHALRTDAAARFEKGTDISNTVNVLKRAALLIVDIAGGSISGKLIDLYPNPIQKNGVELPFVYLRKLSGKLYEPSEVRNILINLGFDIIGETEEKIIVEAPYSKPDITIPADIVEEIMRIDGLDNIDIPDTILIAPAVEQNAEIFALREKAAAYLSASGFYEIFTNSISNSHFYEGDILDTSVKMINSLSSELDVLRPSMLQSGLQAIGYNLNRKNSGLRFYEFGKTYKNEKEGFSEKMHLCVYVSGNANDPDWKNKESKSDIYYLKGIIKNVCTLAGITSLQFKIAEEGKLKKELELWSGKCQIGVLGEVPEKELSKQDIKQAVIYCDIYWGELLKMKRTNEQYREISKYPSAKRDLSLLVDKSIQFETIRLMTQEAHLTDLASVELFDVFESEKLGKDKKSLSINYTFANDSRTLNDRDIEAMMSNLRSLYEKELNAQIRK